jgi:peptide/nickel transport system substrate-binding protein
MGKHGRRALVLLMAVLSMFVIAACGDDDDDDGGGGGGGAGEEAKQGGSITIAQTSQPDYLDPALSYTVNGWEPMWLVYTPPITYKRAEGEEGTELIPGVAEELPKVSKDGKTVTFTMRKGLKFSDGTPLKASDFEHTIKRVLNLESGATGFFVIIEGAEEYVEAGKPDADISGIETNDETGEVTIKLTGPDGTILNVLAMNFAGVVPGDTPFENLSADPPPGIGPYTITESVPNREFVMERNKNFNIPGIPKGNIDTITTKIVKSAERQTQDVISGKLDFMQDPPPADLLPQVKAEYSDRYKDQPSVNTYYFFMNTKVPPFDKKEVRQAVSYGVDSRALSRLFGGRLAPGCNFLPPGLPGHEEIDPCPYGDPNEPGDLEKARELITEAGVEGESVEVYTNNDENRPEIGQYLTDLLNKIGLKAELKVIDAGVYFQTVGNDKTKAAIGATNWFQDFPHPANFLFLIDGDTNQPTNNYNYSRVDDPKLDKLIDQVEAAPAGGATEQAAEADKLAVEEAYVSPYGQETNATFLSERMDFENCTLFHPVYLNDYSSWCLK